MAVLILAALPLSGFSNPNGEVVRFGDVSFDRSGGNLRIIQGSQRAIIDWNAFSIQNGEMTQFRQPGAGAAVLNRVQGGVISRIDGALKANGNVFLLNPNGIVVGPTGTIDVGGFVGSTLDVSDSEFLAGGDLRFRGSSQAAVVNLGSISATDGDIFLMAATVDNSGFIKAPRGTVGLAAGNDVFLKESGEERVFVRGASGGRKENGVINTGVVEANVAELKSYGGNIYGMAVNNEGRVAATGITRSGGQIFLSAGGGKVKSSGTLTARRPTQRSGGSIKVDSGSGGRTEISGRVESSGRRGGSVVILGDDVNILNGTLILADGDISGGQIKVGGGRRGEDGNFLNSINVTVGNGALLDASARDLGSGGEIIVFAENLLTFNGRAAVRGGYAGGDGGFVELSGKSKVNLPSISGAVDASAANGDAGTLLFDPDDVEVVDIDDFGGEASITQILDTDLSIAANGMNVIIETNAQGIGGNGDIFIRADANIRYTSPFDLTFNAARNFVMESGSRFFNDETGDFTVTAGNAVTIGDQLGGLETFVGTGSGRISITGNSMNGGGFNVDSGTIQSASGNIRMNTGGDFLVGRGSLFETQGNGDISVQAGGSIQLMGDSGFTGAGGLISFSAQSGEISLENMVGNVAGIGMAHTQIETIDGNISVIGRGGNGSDETGLVIVDGSILRTTGQGHISVEGLGGGNSASGLANGVQFVSSTLETDQGTILMKGQGGNQSEGIETSGGSITSLSGDITLSGKAGMNGANGILIRQGTIISSGNDALITLEGEASQGVFVEGTDPRTDGLLIDSVAEVAATGSFSAILLEDYTGGGSAGTIITGDGSQNVLLRTLGGGVLANFVEGNELTLEDHSPNIEDFYIDNSAVDFLNSTPAGDITYVSNISGIILNDVGSAGDLSVTAVGSIGIDGKVMAGNSIELLGTSGIETFYQFDVNGSLQARDVLLDSVTPGGYVEVLGDIDITNHRFQNIDFIEGLGANSKLTTDAKGENIRLEDYFGAGSPGEGSAEVAALVNNVPFIGFSQISGGVSADVITVALSEGVNFEGVLSGGGGNDLIEILPTGGGITGTLLGGAGNDTLSYSRFTDGVTLDLEAGTATGVANMGGIENVIGSSSIDTIRGTSAGDVFQVNGANRGLVNGGSFDSFERLVGAGGNDRFEFFNQGTVFDISGDNGNDILFIDDSNLGGTNTYWISENQISRNPTYRFNGIEVVQLKLGPGNDTVNTGDRSFLQIFDGGPGNDTLNTGNGAAVNSNPIVLGGSTIFHSNFENPNNSEVKDIEQPDPGNVLTQQLNNDLPDNFPPDNSGEVTNQFNDTAGPNGGLELFQGNIFTSPAGAFSSILVGQAVVLTVDGSEYSFNKPASLDGEFNVADYATILRLRNNLDLDALVELATAIGYDGSVIMIMEDGGYAIDLGGVPPAQVLARLQQNLGREAAVELLAALEMTIAIPITSEDGVVSILEIPVAPNPAVVAALTEMLNAAAENEMTSALDGE